MNASVKASGCCRSRRRVGAGRGLAHRVRAAPAARGLFADWENERKSADVDALILAWIASHVPGSLHRGRCTSDDSPAQVPSLWSATRGAPSGRPRYRRRLVDSSPTVRPGKPAASK